MKRVIQNQLSSRLPQRLKASSSASEPCAPSLRDQNDLCCELWKASQIHYLWPSEHPDAMLLPIAYCLFQQILTLCWHTGTQNWRDWKCKPPVFFCQSTIQNQPSSASPTEPSGPLSMQRWEFLSTNSSSSPLPRKTRFRPSCKRHFRKRVLQVTATAQSLQQHSCGCSTLGAVIEAARSKQPHHACQINDYFSLNQCISFIMFHGLVQVCRKFFAEILGEVCPFQLCPLG